MDGGGGVFAVNSVRKQERLAVRSWAFLELPDLTSSPDRESASTEYLLVVAYPSRLLDRLGRTREEESTLLGFQMS